MNRVIESISHFRPFKTHYKSSEIQSPKVIVEGSQISVSMNQLISSINKLQNYNQKFHTQIHLPEIVVVGSQSSGKSSVLERIIVYDILPKGSKVATRCPINLQLVHNAYISDITAVFQNDPLNKIVGADNIRKKLQDMTNDIGKEEQAISEIAITVQLTAMTLPTLTLVDLPGIIKNDGELPRGSVERIQQIVRKYVASPFSIILAISAANVDLANSDSIQIAREFDPEGVRTLNVITKIDIMDQGTDAYLILESRLVKNCLGTLLVANRNERSNNDGIPIETANTNETNYLRTHYSRIADKHGINSLVNVLAKKLKEDICRNLPTIKSKVKTRIDELNKELEGIDDITNVNMLSKTIVKFVENYKGYIHGDSDIIYKELKGGALLSQVLYTKFVTEILACKITDLTKEEITLTIANCAGNKKISYSIERPFVMLIRREIEQFVDPSVSALREVSSLMKDFVHDIVLEMNIRNYSTLVDVLETEMEQFIEVKYKDTKCRIESLIQCEQNDVFCVHPNSQFYESLGEPIKNDINEVESTNEETIEKMVLKYFDMVRQNMIYNVPKWIQKFMIEDLLNQMMDTLYKIIGANDDVFKLDSGRECEINEMKEELKELNEIQKDLRNFRI